MFGGGPSHTFNVMLLLRSNSTCRIDREIRYMYNTTYPRALGIRALASARGSVATRRVATGPRARRARGQRARPLEGPKGPRVAKTCESEGPKGPRTSKAKCPSRRLPVLLWQSNLAITATNLLKIIMTKKYWNQWL